MHFTNQPISTLVCNGAGNESEQTSPLYYGLYMLSKAGERRSEEDERWWLREWWQRMAWWIYFEWSELVRLEGRSYIEGSINWLGSFCGSDQLTNSHFRPRKNTNEFDFGRTGSIYLCHLSFFHKYRSRREFINLEEIIIQSEGKFTIS